MFFQEWIQYINTNYNFSIFKKFIISNGIIGTAAGVIIAYSAWDLIKSLVGDVIIPCFYFALIHPWFDKEYTSMFFEPIERIDFPSFTKNLISFIIMIIIAFFSIHYITLNWANSITVAASPSTEEEQTKEEEQTTTASNTTQNMSMEQIQGSGYYKPFQL